jgi:Arc/MetJ-type ribon-helix-helix transcriptional regulator
MAAKKKYMAQGYEGTKHRPGLRKDLSAMTDEAKRKKRLETTVADNQKRIKQGKKSRTISQRDVDRFMSQFRSPAQKIRQLQGRAAKMLGKAKEVEHSKTGNKAAAATYRQVAKELLARIPALRKKKK